VVPIGLIGYFGRERFVVSTDSIYTINGFQISSSPRFASLERIGRKPLTERIAPGLDQVSFSITVDASLGVNPRQILDRWRQLAAAGEPAMLVIGNKGLGTDMWVITSVQESWTQIDGHGRVLQGTINLSFEEYMSQ
jgi:phage protein U